MRMGDIRVVAETGRYSLDSLGGCDRLRNAYDMPSRHRSPVECSHGANGLAELEQDDNGTREDFLELAVVSIGTILSLVYEHSHIVLRNEMELGIRVHMCITDVSIYPKSRASFAQVFVNQLNAITLMLSILWIRKRNQSD